MSIEKRVFEAQLTTVNLEASSISEAFISELFPLFEEFEFESSSLMESDGELSWDQINSLFKNAQKVTNGGIFGQMKTAGSKVQSKVQELVQKHRNEEPVPGASEKIDKMAAKAINAAENTDKNTAKTEIKPLILKLRNLVKRKPQVANMVLSVLSSVTAYASHKQATSVLKSLLSSSVTAIEKEVDRVEPSMNGVDSVDVEDDLDTMPFLSSQPGYNKQNRRAKKGDRKTSLERILRADR